MLSYRELWVEEYKAGEEYFKDMETFKLPLPFAKHIKECFGVQSNHKVNTPTTLELNPSTSTQRVTSTQSKDKHGLYTKWKGQTKTVPNKPLDAHIFTNRLSCAHAQWKFTYLD